MYASTLIHGTGPGAGNGTALALAPARVARPQHGRTTPPAPGGTWLLEHRPEAAADARRITRNSLRAWQIGDDDTGDTVLLVVSELVTNAVEHALAPVHLHLYRTETDGRVWIGVSDAGPAMCDSAWGHSRTPDEHGRGLTIVRTLAEHHGSHTWPGGHTTHWARINPSDPAASTPVRSSTVAARARNSRQTEASGTGIPGSTRTEPSCGPRR
ncbi:ATP-binding protein [Streptomyces sp. NRRL B-24484]|uniref:ATP-binding protein n=1 Tax=Streptomyces sp. NRRL B-24484 TaxID=1463833 RepID=UPI0009987B98|nr:ATP-binding protein [Streptomyces sp. NRRL B-24484]